MKPRIEIEIDELALHGVPESGRAAFVEALVDELGARFASRGVPERWLASGQVDVARGTLAAPSRAGDTLAGGVADAIHGATPREPGGAR